MTFASKHFLFYLFPLFLIAYFWCKELRVRNNVFIFFSLLFYSFSKPLFLVLLLASIGANFRLAIAIDAAGNGRRYQLLTYGVVGNLLALAIFKYAGFLVENLNTLLALASLQLPVPKIALPLGISFYTFHAISYIADVAKRRVKANQHLEEFMLYMSMFPQLVAGPIVRYATVSRQLHERRHTFGRFSAGMRIFIIGLAWKVLLADQVAPLADAVFDQDGVPSLLEAWLGTFAYAMQIYFDFGGYSAMAVGLGVMVGFTLPRNFRIPYAATSMTAFWRRWHMSLSAWLRDYVYIPLGGNRLPAWRTYANLWIVFLLCGLWHGASWTFVIWGAHHGLALVLERAGLGRVLAKLPRPLAHLYTVVVVFLGWVWFRAKDFEHATAMFQGLVGFGELATLSISAHIALLPTVGIALVIAGLLSLWEWRYPQHIAKRVIGPGAIGVTDNALVLALLAICIVMVGASAYSPFLYGRF